MYPETAGVRAHIIIMLQPRRRKRKQSIEKKFAPNLKPGDFVLSHHGEVLRVAKITSEGVELEHKWGEEWSHYGTIEDFRWKDLQFIKLEKPYEELEKEAINQLHNIKELDDEEEQKEDCTALVLNSSKENAQQSKQILLKKMERVTAITYILQSKTDQLRHIRNKFEEKVKYLSKVIDTFELYLGIQEDIIQILEGEKAPIGTPITIRQQIMYMDEEVGDPNDGGIDVNRIEQFDKWIKNSNNRDRIIPEPKGIVVLRVRRYKKDYGDAWINARMEQVNKQTYILIRNGENLYRIWTTLLIHPRVFPLKKEIEEFQDKDGDIWGYDKKELEEREFTYKQNVVLYQGLLDRTQLLQPFEGRIILANDKTWNGQIHLVRDEELLLGEGTLSYKEWKKNCNSKIGVGSRIVLGNIKYWDKQRHLPYGYKNTPPPEPGIYVVKQTQEQYLSFIYNPEDEVWNHGDYGFHTRKRGISFRIHRDEDWILNYDQMSVEEIDFYINNRIDRHNYVDMLPLLWTIRKNLLAEQKYENELVELLSKTYSRIKIKEAIDWWKFKNKWKRPIDKDDKKAYRMIRKKLEKDTLLELQRMMDSALKDEQKFEEK
jgi:hypothetical protein